MKKCKCGTDFVQYTKLMNKCCKCMAEIARVKREKKQARDKKADVTRVKKKLKQLSDNDRSVCTRKAQKAFNAYIRVRDADKPCISCDKPNNGSHQRHASHYRSVGACSQLRFNELNVWASCAQCNSMKSGNLIEYRIRLIKKIGAGKVEWLECQNEIVKYSIEELKSIEKEYKNKLKALQ